MAGAGKRKGLPREIHNKVEKREIKEGTGKVDAMKKELGTNPKGLVFTFVLKVLVHPFRIS